MKRILIIGLLTSINFMFNAQVKNADLSPRSNTKQVVGLTEIIIDYSRPSVRDRKIFGEVVPFNQIWRTGANMNTTIDFSSDVEIAGKQVLTGAYAIYVKPEEKMWTVYFYNETENAGVPDNWETSKIVAEVIIPVELSTLIQETFYIGIEDITTNSANLRLHWENVKANIPINVPTKDLVLQSIETTMAGPSDRDYYNAASFYLDENMSLEKAREYILKATEMRGPEAFWYTRKKALILYATGDLQGAIQAAEISLEYALKAEYDSYIKMNEESLTKWRAEAIKKKQLKSN